MNNNNDESMMNYLANEIAKTYMQGKVGSMEEFAESYVEMYKKAFYVLKKHTDLEKDSIHEVSLNTKEPIPIRPDVKYDKSKYDSIPGVSLNTKEPIRPDVKYYDESKYDGTIKSAIEFLTDEQSNKHHR